MKYILFPFMVIYLLAWFSITILLVLYTVNAFRGIQVEKIEFMYYMVHAIWTNQLWIIFKEFD